jgi:hypothetical protein
MLRALDITVIPTVWDHLTVVDFEQMEQKPWTSDIAEEDRAPTYLQSMGAFARPVDI